MSYDRGVKTDRFFFYPSENAVSVSRTTRAGTIFPKNIVAARPNPRVPGFEPAVIRDVRHVAGPGRGTIDIRAVNSALIPDDHLYAITFTANDSDSIRADHYVMRDSTTHQTLFRFGSDLAGAGTGPVGDGILPILSTPVLPSPDTVRSGWAPGSATNVKVKLSAVDLVGPLAASRNLRRVGYPDSIRIVFDDVVRDTSLISSPYNTRTPMKFRVFAETAEGEKQLDVAFRDVNRDSTFDAANERLIVLTYAPENPTVIQQTWDLSFAGLTGGALVKPKLGDVYEIKVNVPFSVEDQITFTTGAERIDRALAAQQSAADRPYVVPNPYVGSASFEPERFAVSGRGERRIEFRAIPVGATIRIFNVRGDLVQTLRQDGSTAGFVAWNLRTRDNLDLAPGLYIFQVEAPGVKPSVGKFAVVK